MTENPEQRLVIYNEIFKQNDKEQKYKIEKKIVTNICITLNSINKFDLSNRQIDKSIDNDLANTVAFIKLNENIEISDVEKSICQNLNENELEPSKKRFKESESYRNSNMSFTITQNQEAVKFETEQEKNVHYEINEIISINLSSKNFESIAKISSYLISNLNIFENLEKLDLSQNMLENVGSDDFKGLSKLLYLNLSFNRIASIDPSAFISQKSLKIINLSKNKIYILDRFTFHEMSQLKYIDLSFNSIEHLDKDTFCGLNELSTLSLNNNNLQTLHPDILKNLKKLTLVQLSNNYLDSIDSKLFQGLNNLKKIDLASNNISYLDKTTFKQLPDLNIINISSNNIENIDEYLFEDTKLNNVILTSSNYKADYFKNSKLKGINFELINDDLREAIKQKGYNDPKYIKRGHFGTIYYAEDKNDKRA